VSKREGEGRWGSRWGTRWTNRWGGARWGFSKTNEIFVPEQRPPKRIEVFLEDSMQQNDNVQTHISDQSTQSLGLESSRESLSKDLGHNLAKFEALIDILTALVKLFSSAAGKGARYGRAGARITRAPGTYVLNISEFLFSPKTLTMMVNPIIADMQGEYFEALAAGRRYKAICVCVRGYWSLVKALGLFSLVRTVAAVWRKVSI
jgi:hypothetical protein